MVLDRIVRSLSVVFSPPKLKKQQQKIPTIKDRSFPGFNATAQNKADMKVHVISYTLMFFHSSFIFFWVFCPVLFVLLGVG